MKRGSLLGCGLACLGLGIGLTILLVGGVFALTRPVVDASQQFLAQLSQGRIDEAYASTADAFRARLDEASFAKAVKHLGLAEYDSVAWHNRQIDNRDAIAEGTVTTKTGGAKPVVVRLVREGGKWAVVGLSYGGVDITTTSSPPVPSGSEMERMVAESLLEFNRAVRAGDFTTFYATLADVWKKETSSQRLQQAFQEFIDKQIDISPIQNVEPQVGIPAAVNQLGVLSVTGHYLIQSTQVRFELEYAYEHNSWKLRGISVRVTQRDTVK